MTKKPKQKARPVKDDRTNGKRLSIRFTPTEWARIEAMRAGTGLDVSNFLRSRVLASN